MTSSLGISRWKNVQQINECGARGRALSGLDLLGLQLVQGGGSARMIEISKHENFCQQEYCGCIYSLRDTNRHRITRGRERIRLSDLCYGQLQDTLALPPGGAEESR